MSLHPISSPPLDLSIIVPILNEADVLPDLFSSLAMQCGTRFELILCDGGSTDDSPAIVQELAQNAHFPVRIISAEKGRGKQMNSGSKAASSTLLLFLHADSGFAGSDTLAVAVSFYRQNMALATGAVAARFRLRFQRKTDKPSIAYYYYEQKGELNRCDCIRGDQGLLIENSFFKQLGGFETSLPFLEDIKIAEKIAQCGNWILIPVEITTSARRFEIEGLYERQALNAIISCCLALGWDGFFTEFASMYRTHKESGKINLAGVMREIRSLIAAQPQQWRDAFWINVGKYVAANIWQLFFWLDVRRKFSGRGRAEAGQLWLSWYECKGTKLFNSQPIGYCTMVLTKIWFHYHCRR